MIFLVELDQLTSGNLSTPCQTHCSRFIVEADSSDHVNLWVTSLPIWQLAETRVTPLIACGECANTLQH